MENPPGPPAAQAPTPSPFIRTDQVQKLPHLNDGQKAVHTQAVRSYWEILNSHSPTSNEYVNAQAKLTQLSQQLMKGMKLYQQNKGAQSRPQLAQQPQPQPQMQPQPQTQPQPQGQAPAQAPAQAQPQAQGQGQPPQAQTQQDQRTAAQGGGGHTNSQKTMIAIQNFQQLPPHIQARVSAMNFTFPPPMPKEQSDGWLHEAKYRCGVALSKQETAKVRMTEIRQIYSQRQSAGNLTPEEIQELKNRQAHFEKMFREGSEFLAKFKEQQDNFKSQQLNQQFAGRPPQQNIQPMTTRPNQPTDVSRPAQQPGVTAPPPTTAGPPAPHTINSAVVAARNQSAQQQQQPTQTQLPPGTTQPQAQQSVPANASISQPHQPQPGLNPQAQEAASTTQPPTTQGPPRPLSQQGVMEQTAQNYSTTAGQQTVAPTPTHAHPSTYIGARSDTRNVTMAIPKNLNVSTPEPVTMGPSRPTLTTGASHGSMGSMGQPAIQKHPGYVLEGEGQRVLSKKKLDDLVRQVTGGGEGEKLTPDAEEFVLQMADDFVDDVITAACRLAKLRPSSTLDIRDIQLVLERNYNMRIPGFSTDDLRTVKKPHPTQGWIKKMSAVQAAKLTQGRGD